MCSRTKVIDGVRKPHLEVIGGLHSESIFRIMLHMDNYPLPASTVFFFSLSLAADQKHWPIHKCDLVKVKAAISNYLPVPSNRI